MNGFETKRDRRGVIRQVGYSETSLMGTSTELFKNVQIDRVIS